MCSLLSSYCFIYKLQEDDHIHFEQSNERFLGLLLSGCSSGIRIEFKYIRFSKCCVKFDNFRC
jgi:hypothetical protein